MVDAAARIVKGTEKAIIPKINVGPAARMIESLANMPAPVDVTPQAASDVIGVVGVAPSIALEPLPPHLIPREVTDSQIVEPETALESVAAVASMPHPENETQEQSDEPPSSQDTPLE